MCNSPNYIAKYCKATKSESSRRSLQDSTNLDTTKTSGALRRKVEDGTAGETQPNDNCMLQLLYSDSGVSDDGVNTMTKVACHNVSVY